MLYWANKLLFFIQRSMLFLSLKKLFDDFQVSPVYKRNMKWILLLLTSLLSLSCADQSYTEDGKEYLPAPGVSLDQLALENLPPWRTQIIAEALKVRSESTWPKYVFGSASPSKGGFDCSGAIYYTLRRLGYQPERTSSNQYLWLAKQGRISSVSPGVDSLAHPDFQHLLPGDLVFWSGTYEPTDGRTIPVTHVGMYLGQLKGYHRPVMICASKGRYFNGKRRDGFGLYDFKLPSSKSRSKIVAYGAIPPRAQ